MVTGRQAETIVALATPAGRGAIALIRISGPRAKLIVRTQFRSSGAAWEARKPLLGSFLAASGRPIDRVLATYFQAPASYTGEDLVEISCHGSPVIARQILETMLHAGARLAEPGEFTMRAFLNGKMDLSQAEAVRNLVDSRTAFQAQVAVQQSFGKLSRALQPAKKEIIRILSQMETTLEFVEDDAEPLSKEVLAPRLSAVDLLLERLGNSFELGKVVQEGVTVAIVGKPNSGKSSIFNGLLLDDRAIVTQLPGTTRDALTETIDLGGIPARLVDTAGIRDANDPVEQLGVEKSLEYLRSADFALFVLDGATLFDDQDVRVWEFICKVPYVLALNKEDLPQRLKIPAEVKKSCVGDVSVSALKRTHLEDLRQTLKNVIVPAEHPSGDGVLVTSLRHKKCLESARKHLQAGMEAYRAGLSEEFPLYDFRKALDALGQITGETSTEDLLKQIFSEFCIGK